MEAEQFVSVLHLFLYDEHKQSHDTGSLWRQQWTRKDGRPGPFVWSVLLAHCDKTKHCYNELESSEDITWDRLPLWNYVHLLHICMSRFS